MWPRLPLVDGTSHEVSSEIAQVALPDTIISCADRQNDPAVTGTQGSLPGSPSALGFATSEASRVCGAAVVETVDQE